MKINTNLEVQILQDLKDFDEGLLSEVNMIQHTNMSEKMLNEAIENAHKLKELND